MTRTLDSKLQQTSVCLVVHTFPPHSLGGVELYASWLAKSLADQGQRVVVFHPVVQTEGEDYGVRACEQGAITVWTVNRKPGSPHPMFGDARLDRLFKDILVEEQIDVVHFQHLCGYLSGSLVETAKALGLPTVLTLHDSWLFCPRGHAIDYRGKPCSGPESLEKCGICLAQGDAGAANGQAVHTLLRNNYLRRVFDAADLVTATSQYLKGVAEQAPWLPKGKIVVSPLGLAGFETISPAARAPGAPIRLGAFGNFTPFGPDEIDLKGALTLLEAFRQLEPGKFELHFHGRVAGPWKAELEGTPGIVVHGPFPFHPDPRGELLAALDAVVVPSMIEVCPTVPREAFLAGVPVIASRTGGMPEIVKHEENGLLFETGDATALAQALQRLENEPDLLASLWEGVRRPALISEDARNWAERYAGLIGEASAPATDKVISVVIATYNRPKWLGECLEGFCHQTLPQANFEIVVVDDCSTESPAAVISEFQGRLPLAYIRHERNSGLGACRNTGGNAAKGDFVLFFDDDDRPTPRFLAEHLRTHLDFPDVNVAVLGYTAWAPELAVSPVMYHVTQVGKQYLSYPDIPAGVPLDWHYCWGGRSSIKRALLEVETYDPDFHMLEDMELSWRLRRAGLQVVYNPRAVQYGMRELDMAYFCNRWYRQGQGVAQVLRKHPDPELERHFGIRDAVETLGELEPRLPEIEAQISHLTEIPLENLRQIPVNSNLPSGEDLLHYCYRMYFEAFRLRGYLEGLRAGTVARGGLDDAMLSAAEAGGAPGRNQNLLFLAPELPLFDRSSGGFRLFQIVKLAREAGHSVTYIAREPGDVPDPRPYVEALEALGVEVYPYDPDKILDTWDTEVSFPRIDFKALLEERRFDVAYCYFYEIADLYREEIRTFSPATKLVVDSVDLHFLREFRRGQLTHDEKQLERALKVRKKEMASYAAADLVVTVTDVDKLAALVVDPDLKIEVIPNVHPIPAAGGSWSTRRNLVFVGGFNHRPNVEAMQIFCAEIWPEIAERLPDAKLFIVGANPPPAVEALAGDRIVVTGYVPDTLPYLHQCRVSVAPLLYGAGMKGKVGEALAAGLPVVGTAIACEGMGLIDGQHVLVADDPQAMIDAIVRLYSDETLWTQLSAAGRAHIQKYYSPAAVARALGKVLAGTQPTIARRQAPRYKASIVIPVWNRADYTIKCLEALTESIPDDFSYEVVVVDNGSSDATAEFLASLGGDVQVITNKTNLGFAKACNQGAQAARGEWIVFLNNDTEPRAGWLEEMVALGEREDRAGIVGAKLLYPDGTIQHAGVAFTGKAEGKFVIHGEHFDKDVFIDLLPYHLYRKMPADAPYVNKVRDFQVVTGACLAIRQELFDAIGGFDEAFKNGFEDVDLCLKALQQDYRVIYCPTAVVVHHESKSEGRHDHDLPNARIFHERWSDFVVPDDERFYREDGFVSESPQERMTIWRYQESFGRAEELFAAGRLAEALAEFEAFLEAAPEHGGARIKAAVARERLAAKA